MLDAKDLKRLGEVINLATQTSQQNDSGIRQIQDAFRYLNDHDTPKLEKDYGITLDQITTILSNLDSIGVKICTLKTAFNNMVSDTDTPKDKDFLAR